jgi:hypothetical protein
MSRELEVVVENWVVSVVAFVLYGFVCGGFTRVVAGEKGYSESWFWAGVLFGLVGLIAACGLPDRGTRANLQAQREQGPGRATRELPVR